MRYGFYTYENQEIRVPRFSILRQVDQIVAFWIFSYTLALYFVWCNVVTTLQYTMLSLPVIYTISRYATFNNFYEKHIVWALSLPFFKDRASILRENHRFGRMLNLDFENCVLACDYRWSDNTQKATSDARLSYIS